MNTRLICVADVLPHSIVASLSQGEDEDLSARVWVAETDDNGGGD